MRTIGLTKVSTFFSAGPALRCVDPCKQAQITCDQTNFGLIPRVAARYQAASLVSQTQASHWDSGAATLRHSSAGTASTSAYHPQSPWRLWPHTQTHIHTLRYSHSYTHTHILTLTYSHSYTHTHIHTLTYSHSYTHNHILTLTYSHSHTTLIYSHSHTHNHILTLTYSHSHTRTQILTLT